MGKKRSTVANRLRLLEIEPELRAEIAAGRLSAGHAKALLSIELVRRAVEGGPRVIEEGWSVRADRGVGAPGRAKAGAQRRAAGRRAKDPFYRKSRSGCSARLGTKVRVIRPRPAGRIEIDYYSEDDIERILEIITGSVN